MGSVFNSIPTWLAGALQCEFSLSTFVESGLGQGTSALWAEKYFDNCISIEIDSMLIEQFKARYPASAVKVYCGDSGIELAGIATSLSSPALFWLDGHTDDYTPALVEIAAINSSPLGHIIMVDDLRLFGQLPAWPMWSQLITLARDSGRRDTFEIDDVLIAAPFEMAQRISDIILKG